MKSFIEQEAQEKAEEIQIKVGATIHGWGRLLEDGQVFDNQLMVAV